MKGDSPKAIFLNEYQAPDYLIETVDLDFLLTEEKTTVCSVMKMIKQSDGPLVLNGQELELISVKVNGTEVNDDNYTCDDDSLTIDDLPDKFKLEIVTQIEPQNNTSLEGLYQSSGNFCTQCEAEGFRKITYFLDRPDVMAVYTVKITADRDLYPVMLSNGNLIDQGELDHNRHWVKWHDPFKKPSYLFALVTGNLRFIEDSYKAMDGRDICLRIYVEPENIEKCEHAMQSLKKAMLWDEQKYGLIYDLDIYMIVAVNDFNMGAMENKGLNVFNSKYVLASPQTATDHDYDGIESVIAHEYFHNWTGNRVTCRDWFQLSLKEGLTVFRDQEFSSDMTSRSVKRIQDVRVLRSHQFAEDAGPMAHPVRPQSYVEINNFYTVTVYNKGAEVVRMYQSLFGEEGFRRGMDLYFCRHDGQAVTTDDFCAAMSDANKYDLAQFKRWYNQAGTPEITVSDDYNADTATYTLTMVQRCAETADKSPKETFFVPVVVGLIGKDGVNILPSITDNCVVDEQGNILLVLQEEEQRFVFTNLSDKPIPSLLRGFSAPVKIHYDYADNELAYLMINDSDDFNRWQAAQNLIQNTLQALIDNKPEQTESQVSQELVDALRAILKNVELDKGIVAEIFTLPSEVYMAELQDGVVDVDAIHQSLVSLKVFLATVLKDELHHVYKQNCDTSDYEFNSATVAARSLKNMALSYLAYLPDKNSKAMCLDQYNAKHNMTDVMAALYRISDFDNTLKQPVLDDFYQQWQSDPLVLDKWFTIQAQSNADDTLDRVEALLNHEAFSIKNPNKVRSLLGSFAFGNPHFFHEKNGRGYKLVADQLIQLDDLNPQVAARMLQAFSRWKRYDSGRQALMKEQLERILNHEGLSRDCYEIASKTLS